MKLGPLQINWIQSLKEHPERKGDGTLAVFEGENYKACCLGELHLCYHRLNNLPFPLVQRNLRLKGPMLRVLADESGKQKETAGLAFSFEKYGLKDPAGAFFKEIKVKDQYYASLVDMNDSNALTWPEIAEFIENNPELVFSKSV